MTKEQLQPLLQSGEVAYPIYIVSMGWSEDIPAGKEADYQGNRIKDLPVGRFHNGTASSIMEKVLRPESEIAAEYLAQQWPLQLKKGRLNPAEPIIKVTFRRYETWCLTWFSHYTYDVGMSDQDVLASFQRYVDRTMQLNREEGKFEDGYFHEPYCLMGAEDRWRWKGHADSSAPCRCDGCKKHGIIRIDH